MRKFLVKIFATVAVVAGIGVGVSAPATAAPVSAGSVSQHGGKVKTADWWS